MNYLAFVVPMLLLLVAILWMVFPPAQRNYLYGYRTGRSMKNHKNWVFANFVAARALLVIALLQIALHVIAAVFTETGSPSMWSFMMLCDLLLLLAVIPITEIALLAFERYTAAQDQK